MCKFLKLVVIIAVSLLPIRNVHADEGVDGHFCFGKNYFAYEYVRDWDASFGRTVKVIFFCSFNEISTPREFDMKPYKVLGMSCKKDVMVVVGHKRSAIFDVSRVGVANFLKDVSNDLSYQKDPQSNDRIGNWVRLNGPLSSTSDSGHRLVLNAHGDSAQSPSYAELKLLDKYGKLLDTLILFRNGKYQ